MSPLLVRAFLVLGVLSLSAQAEHIGGSGFGRAVAPSGSSGVGVDPCAPVSGASYIGNPPPINNYAMPQTPAAVAPSAQAAGASGGAATGGATAATPAGQPAGAASQGTGRGTSAAATGGGGPAQGAATASTPAAVSSAAAPSSTTAASTDAEAVKRGEVIWGGKCRECHGAKDKAKALAWANGGQNKMTTDGGAPSEFLSGEELADLKAFLQK